jgi:hypothetical protein
MLTLGLAKYSIIIKRHNEFVAIARKLGKKLSMRYGIKPFYSSACHGTDTIAQARSLFYPHVGY